ncbi:MAG: hypothetical protein WCZ18_06245 [Ottowia sp.]|nr:hypothetical protein [Ottowia sp.]
MTLHSRRNDAQPVLWAIGLLLLAALAAVGGWQCRARAASAGSAEVARAAGVQAAPVAPLAMPAESVAGNAGAEVLGPLLPPAAPVRVVEQGTTVAFYFAQDQAQVPPDAARALGAIVRGVAAGQTAVIQAYERNDSSARKTAQRVLSVHNLLVSLGIGEDKIRRTEPESIPAWAQAADTDRVEVSLDAG